MHDRSDKSMHAERSLLDQEAVRKYRSLEKSQLRRVYRMVAGAFRVGELGTQRLKSLYFVFGYGRILFLRRLSFLDRARLIGQFIRVDWNVVHGHRPIEIAWVTELLAERSAAPGETMIEAGCWRGGSTIKFSILCAKFHLKLHVYDSFEGVEQLNAAQQAKEWQFAGQYACPEDVVVANVRRFGRLDVCEFHKGWFSETFGRVPVAGPVRLAYIDCDLAKGTLEVLTGVMRSLASGGYVLSQDFHITPVRRLLLNPATWELLGVDSPVIKLRSVYMAQLEWQ